MKKSHKSQHDFTALSQKAIAQLFGITQQAVGLWDCERNKDKSYNLGGVLKWYVAKQKGKPEGRVELENQRLTLICEKMTLDIDKMKAETIPLETHKQIMAGRALSLKNFFFELFDKNAHQLCHKSIEQIRPICTNLLTAAFNHYASNHR